MERPDKFGIVSKGDRTVGQLEKQRGLSQIEEQEFTAGPIKRVQGPLSSCTSGGAHPGLEFDT